MAGAMLFVAALACTSSSLPSRPSRPTVGVSVRRVAPSELTALWPKDWHDDATLRSTILSQISELAARDLLGARDAKQELQLQKRIYTHFLRRFEASAAGKISERALLVLEDPAADSIVGSCCVALAEANPSGRTRNEPLVQKDGNPLLRPAWPLPWDRTSPLAVARSLLGGADETPSADPGVQLEVERFEARAIMDTLVVANDRRRAGAGRVLVAEAEELARSWGQSSLLLRVEAQNSQARAFYERLGYATPADSPAEVSGRKLVADNWGTKWISARQMPLERRI
jgi:GNAT superfamily N-acetyltransferase